MLFEHQNAMERPLESAVGASTPLLPDFLFPLSTVRVVRGRKGMARISLIFHCMVVTDPSQRWLHGDIRRKCELGKTVCGVKLWDSVTKESQAVRAQQLQKSLWVSLSPHEEPLKSMDPEGTRMRCLNCCWGKSRGGLYLIFLGIKWIYLSWKFLNSQKCVRKYKSLILPPFRGSHG